MIAVIGLGFVGLTTALGLAHKGYKVVCFDVDKARLKKIRANEVPFHEPHLAEFLKKYNNHKFFIADSLGDVMEKSDVIFYCVGTPGKKNGEINLGPLKKALGQGLSLMNKTGFKTIVIKSTVAPSTTKDVIKPFVERRGFTVGKDVGLANCPEFLREGFCWEDFISPDRIVIGADDQRSGNIVEKLFQPFHAPIFKVSLNTAEFIKYLSNAFLANLISFSNDMSMAGEAVGGIDIAHSFKLLHLDRRWFGNPAKMSTYFYPGCGFGGYCLPKDTSALHRTLKKKGYDAAFLKDILAVNEKIKRHFAVKIIRAASGNKRIGILGLSFKPGSDDVRESPALGIIRLLLKEGIRKITAYDPVATENFKKTYNLPINYAKSIQDVVSHSDVIAVLTAWDEFKAKKTNYKDKKIIDGRYFLEGNS